MSDKAKHLMTTRHTNLSIEEPTQQDVASASSSVTEILELFKEFRNMPSMSHDSISKIWLEQALGSVLRDREREGFVPSHWEIESVIKKWLAIRLESHPSLDAFIVTKQTPTEDAESTRSENERLRIQVDRLRSQVEMLKSLVAQERRGAAKAVRMHDQLLAHHDAAEKSLLDTLAQRDGAISTIQAALIGKAEGRLCMTEHYHGEVVDVSDNRITAVFHIGDELIEQTYESKQFLDGQLPNKGDELEACVYIAKSLPRQHEAGSSHGTGESRTPRRNVIPLPRTF